MEENFIPCKESIILNELGFNMNYLGWYNSEYSALSVGETWRSNQNSIPAPLYQQAFRWFREKYHLVIEPCKPFQRQYLTDEDNFEILEFGYIIYEFDQFRGGLRNKIEWDGYENSNENIAELECLKKLIEIVKNK